MSEEALRAIALQVRNWGRWGPDDEIGTLNYITPERIAAACRLATTGKVFALGIPLDRNGPQSGTRARFNPIHTMFRDGGDAPKTPAEVQAMEGYGGSDDWIVMPLQCVTQWDSLAHIFYEGKMYNGYDAALVTSSGAAKNSIDKTTSRLAGRGVLLDVARHKGVKALEPGYAITVADLEATAAAQRVEVLPGDILLVRTGHMSRYLDRNDWRHYDLDPFPGVSVHTAPWLHARQIAAIASDNYAVEVRPSEIAGFRNPFHVVAIPNMGLTLGRDLLPGGPRRRLRGRRPLRLPARRAAAAGGARGGHADQSLRPEIAQTDPRRSPMTDREQAGQKALEFSENLWKHGDFWEFETSDYERARFARTIQILQGARFARGVELGCGAGYFTRLLAPHVDRLVAYDISPTAIERARAAIGPASAIDFRAGNAMDYAWRADGPWDLIVMNDTICYLGWLYSFFDIAWFASEVHEAIRPGGRFLMANTMDKHGYDKLLLPHITRSYRDLVLNVGFTLDREETIQGTKNGVEFATLISLFARR